MQKNKALIIGRFQPIHLGHIKLIKRYCDAGFLVKIGIGSPKKHHEKHNPLTVKEREEQIRLSMGEYKIKNYKIFRIPDIEKDSNYVKHVIKIVGSFDTIITGNPRVLKLFLNYKSKNPWNIESFNETKRPGGKVTSGIIRERWLKKPSKFGIPKTVFEYLKKIEFSKRLRDIEKNIS